MSKKKKSIFTSFICPEWFTGSTNKFVLENLYFLWQFLSVKSQQHFLEKLKSVLQVWRITEIQAVYDSQKKSTSLGDVAKVLKHFHSLNNQSNIWWWVTGFCIFRSDYVDSNYSIGHVSLWIFKVCVLQNTKTVTLFSQFNCIKNTGCKFREFCIYCTFLNVSHDLQNYSTVFVRVVKSTGFCTEI